MGNFGAIAQMRCVPNILKYAWEFAFNAGCFADIRHTRLLAIHLPQGLTPALIERLPKVAHGCTIHQSLLVTPTVKLELT